MDCAYNIITANFSGGKTHATTARVYQWSRGIELCITGADNLPQTFKAHFSVQKKGGVATTIVGIDERVDVPNVLFTIGKDIHVWLGASETEDDAEILYTVDIPVAPAPMPEYYDAEDTGVFDAVVEQVSGYAATATAAANSAGASATAAAGSASAAAASASSAAGSAGAAEQARANAVTAKGQAETAAQTATEKALQTAQNASQAALDAGRAESAAGRAESAEAGAGAAKTAAEAAAQSAAASAATADEKATLAGQSATAAARAEQAAAQSAASIEGDVQIASQKASEAQTAAGQAVAAKDAAVTAQTAAETAATNAGQSASTATTKAAEAAQSASGAAASETAAEAAATRAEQAAATLTVDSALSDTSVNPVQNKVITAEVAQVKNALGALKIIDTASGAIASFPDGAAMPMESLTVEMSPIQDLNGQDAPYPAGGGKNILPPPTQETQTVNGVTVKANADGSITFSGTASSSASINFVFFDLAAGDYILSNIGSNAASSGANTSIYVRDNTNSVTLTSFGLGNSVPGNSFTLAEATNIRFYAVVQSGVTVSGTLYPMIRRSGDGDNTYAPYSNICPISGRESVTVTRTGKNLLEKPAVYYTTIGRNLSDCFFVKAGEYNFSVASVQNATSWRWGIMLKDKDGADLSDMGHRPNPYMTWNNPNGFWLGGSNTTSKSVATNVVEDCYIRIIFAVGDTSASTVANDAQLELGNTATEYEAPQIQSATIQLGQTVYGGTVDVTTGTMTVDRAYFEMQTSKSSDWQKSSSYPGGFYIGRNAFKIDGISLKDNTPFLCSHAKSVSRLADYVYGTCYCDNSLNFRLMDGSATVSDWVAYIQEQKNNGTPVVACGLLATPLIIQLTAEQMTTLKGQNNVWSDADSVSVDYVADPKLYIARLTEPDADMVADANIVNGQYFMVGNSLYLATSNIASGATIVPGVNCTRTNLASALNAINA